MTGDFELRHLIQSLSFLAGGVLVGLAVYYVMLRRLRRYPTITTWGGDQILLRALHDVILVWFSVAGAYGALRSLPLKESISNPIERGLLAIVIISATIVGGRAAADAMKLWAIRTGGGIRASSIFVTISRLVAVIIGLLVLLQTLGVSITPILTALGVGGLAIALALQDTLSNLFAGIHLIASKKIGIGDYIVMEGGTEGYVTDINWRNTSVRTLPGNMNIIPNANIASAIVTNYYRPQQELSVLVQVGVSYDSDLEQVERVTIEVASETLRDVEGGVAEFQPLVRFHTFNDSSIDFTVVLRAREYVDQYLLKHEFVKRLHRRYTQEGIVIPFPIRTVHMQGADADSRDDE